MTSESKSRVVYDNLDTTFVNLWALLRKLTQRGFIGRVRVELEDYTADVFLTGSSTPLVHEIDRAAGTDTVEEAALHRLVLRVRETPGTISVFEGPDEVAAMQGDGTEAVGAEPIQDDHPNSPQTHPAHDRGATNNLEEQGPEISLATGRDEEHPASQTAAPAAAPMENIEWNAIVRTSGELIGAVERALTGADTDFISCFNRARLELADDYVFLDPTIGAFSYSNSTVTLSGEVPPDSYVIGLSEALRRVVGSVATGDRTRRVRERVALELLSVARKRREILDRSGFLAHLDRIAGTKVI
jgi:hypothetical protein